MNFYSVRNFLHLKRHKIARAFVEKERLLADDNAERIVHRHCSLLHGIYDSLLFISNLNTMWSGIILVCFYVFCIKMLRYGRRRIAEHLERDRQDERLFGSE